MGTPTNINTWQVKTASGVWPATISVWQNGHEVPLVQAQVIVGDTGGGAPPSLVWVKPVIGITGGSESGFNDINSQVGPVLARRTYDGNLPANWSVSAAYSDYAANRHSYWSFKPSVMTFPTDTVAKAAFSDFLDTIPPDHDVTIVVWHEPEDNIAAGDWTLSQWGALQDAAAAIVRSKQRENLRFGICFMGPWTFDSRSPYFNFDWDNALDWNLIDVIGIDPYRTQAGSSMSLQTMLTVRNSGSGTGSAPSMLEKLVTYGKPISIMEWGAYNSSEESVATFISDAYAWMCLWNQTHMTAASGWIESALWFNYTLIGSDNPLTGVEIDAYASVVADSKLPPQ